MEELKKSIKLSVGIVTRNRPESLERCLKSLLKQEALLWEIVISDDSDIELENASAEIAKKYNATYIKGPKKGLYANRNHVAKSITGSHLRTMDDDHEFPPGHIAQCLQAIKRNPDAIWTIGETYPDEKALKIKYPTELHPRGYSIPPNNAEDCFAISCGATIYPRKVIDSNHLNVEFYKFGTTYLEYGARLKYLGYNIQILPDTFIIHHIHEVGRSYNDQEMRFSTRFFSMLCFSFKYQPQIKNKLLTVLEIVWRHVIDFKIASSSFKKAYQFYKANMLALK